MENYLKEINDLYKSTPTSQPIQNPTTPSIIPSENYYKGKTFDEYEPDNQVVNLIKTVKNYLARNLSDDLLASFPSDWYRDNGFSDELAEYLESININRLIWRLRFDSVMSGEGFTFPFITKNDINNLLWISVDTTNILWSQRLIDDYKAISFYFLPIEGYYEEVAIVSCVPNTIIYLSLVSEGKTNLPDNGNVNENRFNFYSALVSKTKLPTKNQLLLINWINNPRYENAFVDLEWEIRTLAQTKKDLLTDLMATGCRVYKYNNTGEQGLDTLKAQIERKREYLNNRLPDTQVEQNLASPSSLGEYTPSSVASSFEVYLLTGSQLWVEIINRMGIFHTLSTKGKAQQHSTEILTQNLNAIVLGNSKIKELKTLLIKWINIIIEVKRFTHPKITYNKFKFEYRLPFQDALQQINNVLNTNDNNSSQNNNKPNNNNNEKED